MKVASNIVASRLELEELGINLSELQDNLTLPNPEYAKMLRFGKGRFYKKVEPHICYLRKIKDEYVVPRYYLGKIPTECFFRNLMKDGRELESTCHIKLRDYQQEFITKNEKVISDSTGILLEAPCGHGKTLLGIWLAFQHNRQTLVLVPTYYLAKQWDSRIKEFTDATTVILKSTDTEVPLDKDFTIVVMDLFSCRTLPEALINNIGHVILDEAHRVGAETYLPILDEIPAKYRTALTATFRRNDGVHKILKYHFGKHIQMTNRFPKPFVYGVRTGVTIKGVVSKNRPHTRFLEFLDKHEIPYTQTKGAISVCPREEYLSLLEKSYKEGSINKTTYYEIFKCFKKAEEMSYSVVDSYLNEHCGRRKLIIKMIQECLDAGRTVLFLSKRKDTLKSLHKYFAKYKPALIISETNERSEDEESYLQNTCPLILGVTQLAKEGLDIDRLDTLIIHLPIKDTEQAIGRISRLCERKKFPVCLYPLDDCPITYAVFNNARKFMQINAEYKGDRTLSTLGTVL